MENMQTLSEMSLNYPLTDKGPIKADGTRGHNYTEIYEIHMSPIRSKSSLKILEIGFGGGDSLRLWADYFHDAKIFCFDNNLSRIEEYGYKQREEITILYADQSNKESLLAAIKQTNENFFDVIVDDGSHFENHIMTTFYALFDFVAPGGVYFVEDAPSVLEFQHNQLESFQQFGELIVIKKKS